MLPSTPAPKTLAEVRVLVTAANVYQCMPVRDDLLREFYASILADRKIGLPDREWGWTGINALAILGLSCIFPHIPIKFYLPDMLQFLQDEQVVYDVCGSFPSPPITVAEIEQALIRFAQTHNTLRWDGTEL